MVTPPSQSVRKLPKKRIIPESPDYSQSVGRWYIFKKLPFRKNFLSQRGYHQPPCRCVKMEFAVGTFSLSCELFSHPGTCFRSRGASTVKYGKCFSIQMRSAVEVAWLSKNVWHGSTSVWLRLVALDHTSWYTQADVGFDRVNHSKLIFKIMENHHAR